MYEFLSHDKFHLKDIGDVYVVNNPFAYKRSECPFIGKEVKIDGIIQKVSDVESYAVCPVRKGARIGLLVKKGQ